MIGNEEWVRYIYTLDVVESNKKVSNVEFNLIAEDITGNINVTDLQLQGGNHVTATIPATQDILAPVEFNIDENEWLNTVSNQ